MKLVINIPEELYNYVQSESYDEHLDRRFDYRIRFAVRDATPLSDNATNGDIIQTIYPHYTFEIESFEGFVRCSYDGWYIRLPICWWDAPYKEGDTNGNS